MLITRLRNLLVLMGVFFFWGFVAASNSMLIGFSKSYFHLSQEKAQLLYASFYGAYFYGALAIYLFSHYRQRELIYVWGYKRALIIGLGVSLLGTLALFSIIYAGDPSFLAILAGFFVIALGFSLQQMVANPLLLLLGTSDRRAYRLGMAGGLNSLGTLLGPLVLGKLLFAELKNGLAWQQLGFLYLGLAIFFAILMLALARLRLPVDLQAHNDENSSDKDSGGNSESQILTNLMLIMAGIVPLVLFTDEILIFLPVSRLQFYATLLLSFPILIIFALWRARSLQSGILAKKTVPLGMLAIFCYVGVEVSIPSNFNVFFAKENWHGAYSELWDFVEISKSAIAWYWGSLMIGRWIGIAEILPLRAKVWRFFSYILIVTLGFGVLYSTYRFSFANLIAQGKIFEAGWQYLPVVWIFATLVFWARAKVVFLLTLLVCSALAFLLFGIFAHGVWAFYSMVAVGLSCAMMWPAIFDLVLKGQTIRDTPKISGCMIMMILGGALFSPLQGVIADLPGFEMVRWSYLIPALGLVYLLFFALYCMRIR